MSIRTEVGMPVKTKKPRSGAYRALSEPMIPNTGRWFVYSKMERSVWSHFVRKDAEPGVGG